MIGGRLTMRAHVERAVSPGRDRWNNPLPGAFAPLAVLRCFIWSTSSRKIVDGDKTAMVEDVRGMFELAADLTEGDEIAQVADRRGKVLIAGRLRVEGPVQRKHTHLEAALRRID